MQPVNTEHIKEEKKVPNLRFPEFEGDFSAYMLGNISLDGFNNGVFNDPQKVGTGYRLINVKDMYVGEVIDINELTLLSLDEKVFLKNKVEYGDIFFTRSSLVKEGIAHSNVLLSHADDITYDGHLIRMRPNQSIVAPSYLAYHFKTYTARKQFIIGGKTTTMTTIGQDDVASVRIFIPSLPEQQKIASFLSAVDQKIQQLTRKKELLELYKKGVMQKIFSREIRFKDENGNDFSDWEEKRLGEVGEIVGGGTPETSNPKFWNGGIQWYTPTEIATKYISRSNRTISSLGLHSSSAKLLPIGTLLFTSRATIAEISFALDECSTNQGFQSIIVNRNNYSEFVYYLFTQNKKEFIRRSQGSTFLEISKNEMKKIKVQLPCFKEQKRIGQFMKVIDEKIESIQTQITQTQQFKKGLLQQMFV